MQVTFIGLFCSFALGEFSHFYYTTPYVYQPPLETGQGYEYSTDNTYFSRSFSPVSTFYYTQGSFAFAPQQYQQRSHTNGYGKGIEQKMYAAMHYNNKSIKKTIANNELLLYHLQQLKQTAAEKNKSF